MKLKQKELESIWTHFILEAYCLYYESKGKYMKVTTSKDVEEFLKDLKKDEKNTKWEVIKNDLYRPGRRKPKNCKDPGRPHPDKCLGENNKMCPYFAWCRVEKGEYQAMMKTWEKASKRIDKKLGKGGGCDL